jgi:hypothetical protein
MKNLDRNGRAGKGVVIVIKVVVFSIASIRGGHAVLVTVAWVISQMDVPLQFV